MVLTNGRYDPGKGSQRVLPQFQDALWPWRLRTDSRLHPCVTSTPRVMEGPAHGRVGTTSLGWWRSHYLPRREFRQIIQSLTGMPWWHLQKSPAVRPRVMNPSTPTPNPRGLQRKRLTWNDIHDTSGLVFKAWQRKYKCIYHITRMQFSHAPAECNYRFPKVVEL